MGSLLPPLAPKPAPLPYTNTRLVTSDELATDESYFTGTVVRLYHSPNSHPAVRQTLQGLTPRRVSLGALAVQALVNKRGPDGVVGVIPGEDKHSARLLALCQSCHDAGEVLACTLPSADMVLVPRQPETAAKDGLYFLAYATNLRAVELCERLRQEKQVALVLDLDNTLVDAVSCTIAPADWELLQWRHVCVTNSHGRQIKAQYAPLPGHDPYSDDVWVMHWRAGRINCTFKVRVRRGWADLRGFLVQHADRYAVFVCSKGKREYIQLLWLMLDPLGQLIPETDWDSRLTSTYPDTLAQAANKSALTALGCYDITKPHVPTQVAVPMMCLDDSTEAYEPEYEHSVMYVQEYRPSDLLDADSGNVLRQARARLEAFWTATCTSEGTFAWQAAQSFAVALMKTMQRNPMSSPDDLSYLQVRCAKQGGALWHQFTVREVFGEEGVFIPDDPSTDPPPRPPYVTAEAVLCSACQLPECKPGCPAGTAAAAAVAPLAPPPSGPHDSFAADLSAAASASAVPVPQPVCIDRPVGVAADEAALSEGRSSEDSVLLGLPSPGSVLPLTAPSGLHRLSASAAFVGGVSFGSSDASPTAEPRPKQQRLDGWEAAMHGEHAGPPLAAGGAADGPDAWATVRSSSGGDAQPPAAAQDDGAPPVPARPESALASALRNIGRGLGDDDGMEDDGPLPWGRSKDPPLPAAPPPARWELPQQQQQAQQQAGGGGGGSSALSAALASISRGLVEDGLL